MKRSSTVGTLPGRRRAYHGTKAAEFQTFRTPAWFSPSRSMAESFSGPYGDGCFSAESRVIAVDIDLRRPFVTDDWTVVEGHAASPTWVAARQAEGFDGVHFTSDEGEVEFVVFDAAQIQIVDQGVRRARRNSARAG